MSHSLFQQNQMSHTTKCGTVWGSVISVGFLQAQEVPVLVQNVLANILSLFYELRNKFIYLNL